jgi:hypothetical protein
VLGTESEGMIGYPIEQALDGELPGAAMAAFGESCRDSGHVFLSLYR